ncbi:unnamed protein product [Arctogadus glacialis]
MERADIEEVCIPEELQQNMREQQRDVQRRAQILVTAAEGERAACQTEGLRPPLLLTLPSDLLTMPQDLSRLPPPPPSLSAAEEGEEEQTDSPMM